MLPVNTRPRGFFTFAQNNGDTDYIRLAYALALSLKHTQAEIPYLTVGITPGSEVDPRYAWAFDNIIEIPWGDSAEDSKWKLENEWKSIWITPYHETIKLDCDMLFFTDISAWWKHLESQPNDMLWANRVLDWRGSESNSDYYRKVFTKNSLPNIYTACGYFRKTASSYDVFALAAMIFWNWERFFELYLHYENRPDHPSTDVIFALAMKLLDIEQSSYAPHVIPTFTHMKSQMQGWKDTIVSEDWRNHLETFFTPTGDCKIGNHRQFYPLHYHVKDWLTDEMIGIYEGLIKDGKSMD